VIGRVLLVLLMVGCLWVASGSFLREREPVWYWLTAGYLLCVIRMRLTWRAFSAQCGLTVQATGTRLFMGGYSVQAQAARPPVPRMWIGLPRRDGLTARVVLLPGQVPEEYVKHAAAMAHTWRVHSVRVTSPERGFVQLRVYHSDPIPGVVVRNDRTALPSVDPFRTPDRDMGLRMHVGMVEDGRSWVMDLRTVPHWMVTGITQSGKSTLLRALFVALAPLPVAIVGLDLKGGLEFSPFTPRLSGLATDRKESADLLSEVMNIADDRKAACRAAGVQSVWALSVVPFPIVVLVDEIAELYLQGDASEKALRDRCASLLLRLAQIGAALGIHVVVSGQRIGSDLGAGVTALRAQLGGRVCHRVADEETAKMTLGDIAPEAVEVALMLTPAQQGFAVATDNEGGWLRARSVLTSAEAAASVASRYAGMTPVLPGLARPDGGDRG
jgi:DNA segregation ATPase FtsK/SpoIIIE, S-DNA-T family